METATPVHSLCESFDTSLHALPRTLSRAKPLFVQTVLVPLMTFDLPAPSQAYVRRLLPLASNIPVAESSFGIFAVLNLVDLGN
jgi:hypothetical protein